MNNFEEIILDKLDKLNDDITEVKVAVAKQSVYIEQNTKDLSEHIRRTDILEETLKDQQDCCIERHRGITVKQVAKFVLSSGLISTIIIIANHFFR